MSIDLTNRPLSYSSLKEFAKSPRHYIEYINKPKTPPTDAMKLGSMVHCLLLQSYEFDNQFLIAPEINKRTNAGKEELANLLLNNPNKQIVSNEDYMTASNLVRSAFLNPSIEKVVKDCHSFEEEWREDILTLPYRGFYDGVSEDYILEVKTTNDGSPKSVMSDFYKRKYHIQAGLYSIASAKKIKYLIIETTFPYLSYIASPDNRFIDKGIDEITSLSTSFLNCMNSDNFNAGYEYYYDNEIKISLPWSVDN
jgi:exodeoxyribonuclease VIII